jgi:hypothetical protein
MAAIGVNLGNETLRLVPDRLVALVGPTTQAISGNLQQIFNARELQRDGTVKGNVTLQREGDRDVDRQIDCSISMPSPPSATA